MLNRAKSKTRHQKPGKIELKGGINKRSPLILLLIVLVWSVVLGWGMAEAMDFSSNSSKEKIAQIVKVDNLSPDQQPNNLKSSIQNLTSVDPVPSRYQLGQELYLENCSSCHIAIPPQVFPTGTWQQLLEDQQHYGTKLQPFIGPTLLLMWDYLRTFSRPQTQNEPIPYRVSESRYFKALHPKVDLPRNMKLASCITCHPGTTQFNFRKLTPEWENSP